MQCTQLYSYFYFMYGSCDLVAFPLHHALISFARPHRHPTPKYISKSSVDWTCNSFFFSAGPSSLKVTWQLLFPKTDLRLEENIEMKGKGATESALIWKRCLINILGQRTSLYLNHQCRLYHMVLPQDASQPTRQRSHVSAFTQWSTQTIRLAGVPSVSKMGGIDLRLPLCTGVPNSS